MRRLSALTLACAVLGGCAGYIPDVREQEKVPAGKLVRIAPRTPPEGEVISWDPGDGSKPVVGPELKHAWQKPGRYTVRASGPGGTKSFTVEVVPRSALSMVPADAGMAIVLPDVWVKLPKLVALADRISPKGEGERALKDLEAKLGIDLKRLETVEAQGIDPAEGFALLKLAGDDDATWTLIGTTDDGKAMELGKKLLEAGEPQQHLTDAGPFAVSRDPAGKQVAWGAGGGYLVMRMPSTVARTDLPQLFAKLVEQPAGELAGDPVFQKGRAQAAGDDLLFFVRTDRMKLPGDAGKGESAVVAGLTLGEDSIDATFFAPLTGEKAEAMQKATRSLAPPQDLAARIPDGAVAFFGTSFDPKTLAAELLRSPSDRAAVDMVVFGKLGMPLDDLLAMLSGQVALGVYLEADDALRSFARAERAGPSSEDIPPMVLLLGLSDPKSVPAQLARVFERIGAQPVAGGWELAGTKISLGGGVLAGATGSAQKLLGKQGRGQLREAVGAELLAAGGETILYIDLAALHDGLREARPPKDLPPEDQASLRRKQADLEPLRPFRDFLVHAHGAPDGFAGRMRVRLRPLPRTAER